MKKVLLSFLLVGSVNVLFGQVNNPNYPCPIEIKSNQGGGDCPDFEGQKGTAVVTLTFATPPTCVPKLLAVTDHDNDTRFLQSGIGIQKPAPNDNMVEYCLYGDNDENFFNQPDLIATLQYTCPDPSNPSSTITVVVRCNEEGEEIPLPVSFKAFNATRESSTVLLTWTTAMELNNTGFNVQRLVSGRWQTVAFVPSTAVGGNSSSEITYTYADMNNETGITQYRIQQVDLNGHFTYSDIKAMRGSATSNKIVIYPNPTTDGKLNVVFEDKLGIRDVQVSDMQGRIIRSYKGITNNLLVIEKLTSGVYTIKVSNHSTAASAIQKVVVR